MAATDWDGTTFEAHRPLLFSIAYRMLGSASEAEDVVQDAWLRARQDQHADVRSPRAYLTTMGTRLCIDHLRSAERTRMEYPGPWLPEPLAEPNQESAELASSLTTSCAIRSPATAPTRSTSPTAAFARSTSCATLTSCAGSSSTRIERGSRMAILDLAAIPTFASDTTFHVVVESPRLGRQAEYEPRW